MNACCNFCLLFLIFLCLIKITTTQRKAVAHLTGIIKDATNAIPITTTPTSLIFTDTDYNNVYEATFNPNGVYKVTLPIGSYSSTITVPGYAVLTYKLSVLTTEDKSQGNDLNISPSLKGGYRMILTWDETPDLDTHIKTPAGEHISYQNTKGDGVSLDHDVTTGYGPETLTITKAQKGVYLYYVHYYRGTKPMAQTQAKVVFYKEDTALYHWEIPTSPVDSTSKYWNLFKFNAVDESMQVVSQISATPFFT